MFECFFDGLRMSGGYLLFSAPNLRNTYIKDVEYGLQKVFVSPTERLQIDLKVLNELIRKFLKYFSSKYQFSGNSLSFGDFIKELNKAINKENSIRRKNDEPELDKLTKKDEFEWLELFEENKKKAQDLQSQINTTERDIDAMVYELYGLSEEEIAIVEGA